MITEPEFLWILPELAGICRNSKSRRIRDASGIGTSSAEICIWPVDRLLAPAAALGLSLSRSPRHVLVIALQHAGRGMRARISMPAAVLVVNPLDLGDVFEK